MPRCQRTPNDFTRRSDPLKTNRGPVAQLDKTAGLNPKSIGSYRGVQQSKQATRPQRWHWI